MGFMKPTAVHFSKAEARECVLDPDDDPDDAVGGWYGYLSADGYLDRTDYTGPHDSYEEAVEAVKDLYEVDDEGDIVGEDNDDDDAGSDE